jgi:hypothetical protein
MTKCTANTKVLQGVGHKSQKGGGSQVFGNIFSAVLLSNESSMQK